MTFLGREESKGDSMVWRSELTLICWRLSRRMGCAASRVAPNGQISRLFTTLETALGELNSWILAV
jgi:hypothetical protein